MRWIPILVPACITSKNVLTYICFSSGLCGNIKFEAHNHGLLNFSKKDSAKRHALKTKFIFNSSLLFSKRKFSDKKSVLK